jgi:hypothetical protein
MSDTWGSFDTFNLPSEDLLAKLCTTAVPFYGGSGRDQRGLAFPGEPIGGSGGYRYTHLMVWHDRPTGPISHTDTLVQEAGALSRTYNSREVPISKDAFDRVWDAAVARRGEPVRGL